jgi:hypothetical protein
MSLNDMVAESFVKEFPMTESQVLKWPIPYQECKVTEYNYHKEFSNWASVTVSFKAPFDSS